MIVKISKNIPGAAFISVPFIIYSMFINIVFFRENIFIGIIYFLIISFVIFLALAFFILEYRIYKNIIFILIAIGLSFVLCFFSMFEYDIFGTNDYYIIFGVFLVVSYLMHVFVNGVA